MPEFDVVAVLPAVSGDETEPFEVVGVATCIPPVVGVAFDCGVGYSCLNGCGLYSWCLYSVFTARVSDGMNMEGLEEEGDDEEVEEGDWWL